MQIKSNQALKLMHGVSTAMVRNEHPDLSLRQIAILMIVYMEPPPHTVRGLAAGLGVTKPVVTRALDTMGQMNLLDRRRDEDDRRNVVVTRTLEGSLFLDQLADLVCEKMLEIN